MTKKPRLLVVDNEIDICNFVKSFFSIRGFDVLTALNGDEALAVLTHVKPEVVILDVVMRSEHEGLDYLPRIRESAPAAKIIMVTGVDDKDSVEKAMSHGANDYVTKPLVLEHLEATVSGKARHHRGIKH